MRLHAKKRKEPTLFLSKMDRILLRVEGDPCTLHVIGTAKSQNGDSQTPTALLTNSPSPSRDFPTAHRPADCPSQYASVRPSCPRSAWYSAPADICGQLDAVVPLSGRMIASQPFAVEKERKKLTRSPTDHICRYHVLWRRWSDVQLFLLRSFSGSRCCSILSDYDSHWSQTNVTTGNK